MAVIKKQKDTGVWGGNLLGLAASAPQGIKDVGTIPQYRRLLQLGGSTRYQWHAAQPVHHHQQRGLGAVQLEAQ